MVGGEDVNATEVGLSLIVTGLKKYANQQKPLCREIESTHSMQTAAVLKE